MWGFHGVLLHRSGLAPSPAIVPLGGGLGGFWTSVRGPYLTEVSGDSSQGGMQFYSPFFLILLLVIGIFISASPPPPPLREASHRPEGCPRGVPPAPPCPPPPARGLLHDTQAILERLCPNVFKRWGGEEGCTGYTILKNGIQRPGSPVKYFPHSQNTRLCTLPVHWRVIWFIFCFGLLIVCGV